MFAVSSPTFKPYQKTIETGLYKVVYTIRVESNGNTTFQQSRMVLLALFAIEFSGGAEASAARG
jgi:hypothetical protein